MDPKMVGFPWGQWNQFEQRAGRGATALNLQLNSQMFLLERPTVFPALYAGYRPAVYPALGAGNHLFFSCVESASTFSDSGSTQVPDQQAMDGQLPKSSKPRSTWSIRSSIRPSHLQCRWISSPPTSPRAKGRHNINFQILWCQWDRTVGRRSRKTKEVCLTQGYAIESNGTDAGSRNWPGNCIIIVAFAAPQASVIFLLSSFFKNTWSAWIWDRLTARPRPL